jgi:RNA polymerase sigma-70 factor (ECF subfamily)
MSRTIRDVNAVVTADAGLAARDTRAVAPTIEQIVAREGEFLWITLQRLGVRREHCSDVAQDVLLVVHKKLHTYDPELPLRAWLYGICLHEASNHRRRAWVRREQPVEPGSFGNGEGDTGANPERALVEREQQARLEAMLDELDPEKRAVLVMYEIEELSCEQIALTHGIPVGTVHSRLHAARNAFRAVVARWTKREDRARGRR